MLIYRILADVTVVIHAALASFVVLGLLAVLVGRVAGWQWVRNFWFRTIHLGMIAAIVVFPLIGGLCPLTELENWLRKQGGGESYPGSFIAYWVHELLFVEVSSQVIAVSYCAFGVAVLLTFFLVPPMWPKGRNLNGN
jgi:ABC-type glycerol-3-phosphate transport system permease component